MIDTHHHLWRYSPEEYPWILANSALAKDHFLPELKAATAAAGVDGTVVVQARQTLEESDWLLALADEGEIIAGVVGWVPLVDDGVGSHLERLAAHPKFKGVRHVLQEEPDEYFLRENFHRGLSLLPGLDLRYDLLILQRQLPVAIQLVDRQPELGMVINHIAKPEIHKGRVEPEWKKGMAELARRENILGVKISGMATEVVDPELDEETLRIYFEETVALFGPDRIVFGTDWPVSQSRLDSYEAWPRMLDRITGLLSPTEKSAFLRTNATRIYQL